MPSLPEPAPADDLLNEALQQVGATSDEARTLHGGLRQLKGFTSDELAGKAARAVSEAMITLARTRSLMSSRSYPARVAMIASCIRPCTL